LIFAFYIIPVFDGILLWRENFNCYAQEATPLTQQKISLDIKGMDILDVLKMFSQRASINIVAGKNVTGRVTMFLKDVDVWEAFEIIILANGLAYERKGEIINVMTQRDYELIYGRKFAEKKQLLTLPLKYAKATTLAQVLNQVKSKIGTVVIDESSDTLIIMDIPDKLNQMKQIVKDLDRPLETKVFNLNYAQAEEINSKIQELVTKGIGSVRIDERTNKIVITDYREKMPEIEKVISAFDEKSRQVLIDAQIVEITPQRDEFKMGVDWDYWIKKNLRIASSLPMGTENKLSIGTAAGNLSVAEKGEYKGVLDLLRTIGKTKILSSPRIMAINNQEAKILVGTKEVYLTETVSQPGTGSTVTATQVNFVDVGVQLYVTPTINEEGFITMKIRPVISSAEYREIKSEDKVSEVPIVSTSEAETQVLVKDGVTIMIAGLKKDKKEKEVKKIPVFGDIPLLGYLFRSTKDVVTKTELVIFLTPHIVSGDRPVEYVSLSEDEDIHRIQADAKLASFVSALIEEKRSQGANEYFRDVKDRIIHIANKIIPRQEFVQGEVEASFTILADGRLKEDSLMVASPNESLNELVMECIEKAEPFLPFPNDLEKKEERFSLILSFDREAVAK
jgi:type II secretory pathway component GspD/PulD (secretin)